jgi:hypothetical protein
LWRESRRETGLFDEQATDPGLTQAGVRIRVIHYVWPSPAVEGSSLVTDPVHYGSDQDAHELIVNTPP